jgi:Viral coat protein P2 N-terminal domain
VGKGEKTMWIKNLPFFNVVADGIASLEMPLGMTYNRIVLQLGGTTFTKAMIARIVCKLNGKIFYDITGSRLDLINTYRGLKQDTAHLVIDYNEPKAKTIGGMYAGAIGTASGVNAFTVEVTISGATAPTLESWSMITEPQPLGLINALVHHPVTFSAGGKFPIVLPYGPNAKHLIERVHFFHTNMTELEIKKNGIIIFEAMATAVNEFIQEDYGKVPQAGLYVYDAVVDNSMKRVLDTSNAQSLQFNTTVSAADTVDVYGEYVTELANL